MSEQPDYQLVHRRIQRLWEDGAVQVLPDAQAHMAQAGLDAHDLANILKHGRIVGHRELHHTWRYHIQGTTVEGAMASCEVEAEENLVITTVST